jgi:aryl-alcohol dehydrogenase (NADP+)
MAGGAKWVLIADEEAVRMQYRTLGGTGTVVSAQCLGTMTFGKESDEQVAHAQLDRFVEAGGNFVDTADVYQRGVSEEMIGRWLAARPGVRDRLVIATKGRFPMGEGRTTSACPAVI